MVRISKDPEERKNEIVDAAEELFYSKGYEKTSVSDIVKKVGVAQGLFYYYFKCKDEILNALAEKYLNSLMKKTKKVTDSPQYDAVEKIHKLIEEMLDVFGIRKKGIMSLAKHFHNDDNMVMHQKVSKKYVELMTPVISEVVRQGVIEKSFDTEYPYEVTQTLLMWAGMLHINIKFPLEYSEVLEKRIMAIEDFVERLLGAKKGTMNFVQYGRWLKHD
ncbi:TetR/AcrR family transcriptional regulator [Pseudobacteroides cellulosolvens]|uniref:Transcriptional regulator, TetR family n=1 Tax=Pseudobacteroides cellulosolvens ATCC 35603 = DSM 2933 TaxID=398512 RepID=A0A0L6JJC4_9FIRM|nr:TetR/AcrR family transcriptional regulator [Pseudobacteroides cellulosolvens]KNY25783.1 transcriptional regulator, TetR family [Pseudobacteroides cellulosolvens ATCC 35603 = DSM 2933]